MSRFSINKDPVQAYPMFLEGESYPWAAGQNITFKLDFLSKAKQLRYPVIKSLAIRSDCTTLTTGASAGPMRMLPMMYGSVRVRDLNGIRYNVRGSSLRLINQVLNPTYGDTLQCSPSANIGASTTGARVHYLPIRFDWPHRFRRPRDFGLPLAMLLDGGEVSVSCAAAAALTSGYITVTAATFKLVAEVVDLGVPEIGPVLNFNDWDIGKSEDYYPVNGFLALALAYAGEGGLAAQTAWADHTESSKTFDMNALQDDILVEFYRQKQIVLRQAIVADTVTSFAAGQTEDACLTGECVPLFTPNNIQPTIDLPYLENVHYKTSIATASLPATTPRFIVGSIDPGRNPVASERAIPGITRLPDSALVAVTSDGNNPRVDQVNAKVRALTAIRVGSAPKRK